MKRFPTSGEINRKFIDQQGAIAAVKSRHLINAIRADNADALSVEYSEWRINLRSSNTGLLLQLYGQSSGDQALMQDKTAEIPTVQETFA